MNKVLFNFDNNSHIRLEILVDLGFNIEHLLNII